MFTAVQASLNLISKKKKATKIIATFLAFA